MTLGWLVKKRSKRDETHVVCGFHDVVTTWTLFDCQCNTGLSDDQSLGANMQEENNLAKLEDIVGIHL